MSLSNALQAKRVLISKRGPKTAHLLMTTIPISNLLVHPLSHSILSMCRTQQINSGLLAQQIKTRQVSKTYPSNLTFLSNLIKLKQRVSSVQVVKPSFLLFITSRFFSRIQVVFRLHTKIYSHLSRCKLKIVLINQRPPRCSLQINKACKW